MTWTTRSCTAADAAAVTELFRVHDALEFGSPQMELGDVEQILGGDGKAWLAVDDVPVGFAHVQRNGECDTVVDPDYHQALRPALVEKVIAGARAFGVSTIEHWAGPGERLTAPALTRFGFRHAVTTWNLRHDLADLTEPVWRDGVSLVPFDRERDGREVWTLITEAFRGTGFSHERSYDEWARLVLDAGFDVLSARRDGRLVGCATHGTRLGDGYVGQLAVADEARGQGLARALLLEAFRRDRDLGRPATTLHVDGKNDSARRLYGRVGMTVTQEYRRWELTL